MGKPTFDTCKSENDGTVPGARDRVGDWSGTGWQAGARWLVRASAFLDLQVSSRGYLALNT